jgi:hypothetical protein
MTSTARDKIYGRRGGRWAETRKGATCQTCRNGDARHEVRHEVTGELWRSCETCAVQAKRLRAPVTFGPLEVAP